MKTILITTLTLISFTTFGQEHFLGIKGGLNLTNVNSNDFMASDRATGIQTGLSYEYWINDKISIGSDLTYNQRGFNNDMILRDEFGNMTGKATTEFHYDYLSLPLTTGLNFGNKLLGFGKIGIVPSLLIDAKTITPTVNIDRQITGSETTDVTDKVTKFDFAGLIEIGCAYKLKSKYLIFTSFSFQQSFTSITNSEYFSDSKAKHQILAWTIGLKYKLR